MKCGTSGQFCSQVGNVIGGGGYSECVKVEVLGGYALPPSKMYESGLMPGGSFMKAG